METIEKLELAKRTRTRNALIWLTLDAGGILAPLGALETLMDGIASPAIENFVAISDEAWHIKEYQRDRTTEMSQAEIAQEVALADAKVATGRAKLAIQRTADEYTLAARVYDARVKSLLMGAREYAALVEREQLANEEARAGLAVDKEGLRLAKVKADIYLETIQQAQVQADLARAQVDVAKAHVRAAMAGIEAGRAEIDLIEAETQKYVAEADKATLHADVAMIWAEIVTKKLSEIKLDIGRKEIAAGFTYIQTKLDDMLALYDVRRILEEIRTAAEVELQDEISLNMVADKTQEDLRETEVNNARVALTYEEGQTALNIQQDAAQREAHVAARNRLNDARLFQSTSRDVKQSWAQKLINTAQKYVHKHSQSGTTTFHTEYEYISG